jgi:hypothetical protein
MAYYEAAPLQLTEAQMTQLRVWIANRAPGLTCHVCQGQHGWAIEGLVAAPTLVAGLHLGRPRTPLVQMTCSNCFNVIFFAAVPIGLIQ